MAEILSLKFIINNETDIVIHLINKQCYNNYYIFATHYETKLVSSSGY